MSVLADISSVLKIGPVGLTCRPLALLLVFYGAQLDHLLLQSIQLVLRKQLYALVHDLGFPAELEQVGFEYWTLYISKLTAYRGEETSATMATQQEGLDRDSEQDSHDEDERKGDQAHDELPDAIDKMDEFLQQDLDSSSDEEEDGDDDDDDDDDKADVAAAVEEQEHRKTSLSKGRGRPPTGRRSMFTWNGPDPYALRMTFTIAICYLSALHLKLPVVMGDFYR
ncbi:hypothetical protein BGZ68_008519 [Mortierella alpina]|nr:hypothetical protein BGZ68_008519 [Mortierella alpina]